jgi:carbamoyltransferase
VNDWLNRRLNRSEFMPFAPATITDAAGDMYLGLDKGRDPSRYMAMTFDCTARMRDEAPAAIHVDGTARPQVVSAEEHPDLHRTLSAYRTRTGLSSIINTSFNMHEEPIVRTAEDALRAYKESGLRYLALGDFLVDAGEG